MVWSWILLILCFVRMSTLVFNNVIGIFLDFKILNKIWFNNSVINGKGTSRRECRCFNKWLQSTHSAVAQKHSGKTNMRSPLSFQYTILCSIRNSFQVAVFLCDVSLGSEPKQILGHFHNYPIHEIYLTYINML